MEDIKSTNKLISNNVKGVLTLIGCIMANILIGNSLIWLYLPEKADYYFEDILKTKKLIVSVILTSSNVTKLFFSFYTKYNNIRIVLGEKLV